jgi:hypothetical protein
MTDPLVRQKAQEWLRETYFVAALARLLGSADAAHSGACALRTAELEQLAQALDDARALVCSRLGLESVASGGPGSVASAAARSDADT